MTITGIWELITAIGATITVTLGFGAILQKYHNNRAIDTAVKKVETRTNERLIKVENKLEKLDDELNVNRISITRVQSDIAKLSENHDKLHFSVNRLAEQNSKDYHRLEQKLDKLSDIVIRVVTEKSD